MKAVVKAFPKQAKPTATEQTKEAAHERAVWVWFKWGGAIVEILG